MLGHMTNRKYSDSHFFRSTHFGDIQFFLENKQTRLGHQFSPKIEKLTFSPAIWILLEWKYRTLIDNQKIQFYARNKPFMSLNKKDMLNQSFCKLAWFAQ